METFEFLKPVLALVIWTCVMWIWMYSLRLPAFNKAGIKPDDARHPGVGPASRRCVPCPVLSS